MADVPVRLRYVAASPPENVDVEFVPTTLINPWIVEVPVVLPWMVVVAVPPTYSVLNTDAMVEEEFAKVWRPVHEFVFPRLSVSVRLAERSPPPESPAPAEMVVPGAT